jgi:hypothetical protein
MCRAGAARVDLRKSRQARHMAARAAGRAAPALPADLQFRAGRALSDDDGGRQTHGVQADRGLAVRGVREAARPRHSCLLARQAEAAPHDAGQPGRLGVRDLRQAPRRTARVPAANRLQGPQTAGRRRRAQAEAQGRQGTAGSEAQAGRRRPAGPRPRPEAGRQDQAAQHAAAGRRARAGDLRRPRLPEIRLQTVLARHGRLSRPARRRRLTCT